MPEQVEGRILDIKPMVLLKITLEMKEEDGQVTKGDSLFVLDQSESKFYDLAGHPVEENLQDALDQWLTQKQEDVKKEMMGGLSKATPEQLAAMGIDINDIHATPENPKIILQR